MSRTKMETTRRRDFYVITFFIQVSINVVAALIARYIIYKGDVMKEFFNVTTLLFILYSLFPLLTYHIAYVLWSKRRDKRVTKEILDDLTSKNTDELEKLKTKTKSDALNENKEELKQYLNIIDIRCTDAKLFKEKKHFGIELALTNYTLNKVDVVSHDGAALRVNINVADKDYILTAEDNIRSVSVEIMSEKKIQFYGDVELDGINIEIPYGCFQWELFISKQEELIYKVKGRDEFSIRK